ncbi:YggS family pyridoxal phosphate-dependent enzyme [Sulfurimonas sp. HSL-1716]|uniref:YggS family pyridoxal phosphate-dependent enzyme n=1 Tax=Hydrocurvibacter sulfurireducens TaxID=3131937 RepID=UPI0031F9DDA3
MTQLEYKLHIDSIIERVEKARLSLSAHHIVKIVAVSKYSTSEEIKALYEIGQRAFGENRVQDLAKKSEELEDLPLEWHFIGNLQKNKINQLIKTNPFLFQSLDSLELALELDKRLEAHGVKMEALLQINSAYEETKSGVMPEAAIDIYEEIASLCKNIHLKGVMSIGAHTDEREKIKKSFEATHDIYSRLKGATICSMGMSTDFELAIACGSNMVRIGSLMFNK